MNGAAIIGAGLVGEKRARALVALGIPIVAIFDADPNRSAALVAKLPDGTRVAATAPGACLAEGVDFVIVATTHDALAGLALGAVAAGKHVLIEKPGARRRDELGPVRDEANRRGLVVRIGYNHRFHPSVLEAKAAIDSGEFGNVMTLRARYGHGGRVGYEAEWRADAARSGGGELLDQGSHLIDLTRFFVGDARLDYAALRTDYWAMAVEDNAFLALRADSGAFAWLHASWTEWKNLFAIEISLERARLDLFGLGGSYGREQLTVHAMRPELGPPDSVETGWEGEDLSWQHELEDVLAEIEGSDSVGADINDGLAALEIVEAAYAQ